MKLLNVEIGEGPTEKVSWEWPGITKSNMLSTIIQIQDDLIENRTINAVLDMEALQQWSMLSKAAD